MASNVNSRVARRMLLLFVVASLIPLGIFAILTFLQVRSDLEKDYSESLRGIAKSVAMDFHLRMVVAHEQVAIISQLTANKALVGVKLVESKSMSRLSSIWLIGDGKEQVLKGDKNKKAPRVMVGQHITFGIVPLAKYSADVLIADSFEIDGKPYQLIASLDRKLLWENVRSLGESVCISTPEGVQIYCNMDPSTSWREELDLHVRISDSGFYLTKENYYTAYWSLFETAVDGIPQFISAVAMPKEEALGSIKEFESIFVRVTVLTILLIGFVSMRAIRASLDPLEKLLGATRLLSEGHFSSRVELNTGDEFEELGGSFNRMADQLGKQFDLQVTMSALGQQLQGVAGIEPTIKLVFTAVKKVIHCNWLMVTYIVDEGRETSSYIYISDSSDHKQHRKLEVSGTPHFSNRVVLATGAELMDSYEGFRSELQADKKYYVVPGIDDGEIVAILIIGAQQMDGLSDSLSLILSQIGVLLASSLSNVFLTDRLYHQAHHDHLTGLPNRLYLKNTIEREIQKGTGGSLVVSIFDIDRFKLINDTQGHAAGDELLIQVGERLRKVLDPSATPSRFAGDEFIILSRHQAAEVDDSELIDRVVEPIKQVFTEPFPIGNRLLKVEASLGLARFPLDGDNFVTLLRNADAAMYQAKKVNPGGHCFYTVKLQQELTERIDIEIALASAIAGAEFEMYYQPIIELKTRRVSGAEALLRWNRPGLGQWLPDQFIGIAEETGFILAIGDWVMLESCRTFKQMLDFRQGLSTVAVNVSGLQLAQPDFVESVKKNLELSGLPARYLEIEITETCLIDNIEATITKLEAIRAMGVRVAVDDFGTGYSSLQYLKRLPIDKLKIDQMFVRGLPHDENDVAIVRSLVSLSSELKLTVLAEGCETEAQAQFLENESIYKVQGWLFSKALAKGEFLEYVRLQNSPSAEVVA